MGDEVIELIRAGFCRDMNLGRADDASLDDVRGAERHPDQDRILAYLRAGHALDSNIPNLDDGHETGPCYMTDGTFAWSSELPRYVSAYHVRLPEAFVAHMAALYWQAPERVDVAQVALPAPEPSWTELLDEVRDAWPAIASEVDVAELQQRVSDLAHAAQDFVNTLVTTASDAFGDWLQEQAAARDRRADETASPESSHLTLVTDDAPTPEPERHDTEP